MTVMDDSLAAASDTQTPSDGGKDAFALGRAAAGDVRAFEQLVAGHKARIGRLVYRLLGWKSGEFSFERTGEPVMPNIQESTEALILEGMKRFDEWEHVEAELPNMHVVLRQRAFAVNEHFDKLSPEAQKVLRLVDARRDVATIVRESGLEPMQAVMAVTELLSEGIVEQWRGASPAQDVLATKGHLPEAEGSIDMRSSSYFSSKQQLTQARKGVGLPDPGDGVGSE